MRRSPVQHRDLPWCAFLLLAACASDYRQSGDVRPCEDEATIRVPLESAEGQLDLRFTSGALRVGPGDCGHLVVGSCRYRGEPARPSLAIVDDAALARVGLAPTAASPDDPSMESHWDLSVSESIPWTMDVDVRTCDGVLDLSGVPLTALDLAMARSDVHVHFDVPNPRVLESMSIAASWADVTVRRLGNARAERIRVDGGDGRIELNLQGAWERSSEIEIDAGLSDIVLALPHDLPMRILGPEDLVLDGFRREGGAWVNSAWTDEDAIHVAVRLDPGLGEVTVRHL